MDDFESSRVRKMRHTPAIPTSKYFLVREALAATAPLCRSPMNCAVPIRVRQLDETLYHYDHPQRN